MPSPDLTPFAYPDPPAQPDPNDPRALDLFRAAGAAEAPTGLVGVPFDGAVAGRKGAADGPSAIREALRFCSSYHWESRRQLEPGEVGDYGDVAVEPEDTAETHARVRRAIAELIRAGRHPVVLGGDNSITWATVAGLLDAVDGRVGIVDLDAHLDVRVSEPVVNSGTPFRRIVQDFPDRVAASNVAQIGHRQFANAKAYREWAEAKGVRVFDMERVRRDGFDAVLEEAVGAAGDGTDHLVLSVDMDALDMVYVPGVSAPTPGGLVPDDLFRTVRRLAGEPRTRLGEFVEIAPGLDPTGNSARLGAVAVMEYLAHR